MWSTLIVNVRNFKDVRMMSRWLQFADKHPLSITLFANGDCTIADLAVDVLLERQAYWFQIDLHWGLGDSAPLLAHSFTPKNAPILQRFTISTNLQDSGTLESAVDARLGNLLASSTDLRTFEWSLQYVTLPFDPIRLTGIPFNNLRHLKLGCCMAFSSCLDILRRTPLLETCDLIHVEYVHNSSSPDIIQLPGLTSLCVKTTRDMSGFLDALVLPSLQRIELVFRVYDSYELDWLDATEDDFDEWPHAAFQSLLQRSECPLKELNLATSATADQLLEYLLLVSPTLETLSLRGALGWACVDYHAITQLTILPDSSAAVLCPKLRTLKLDDCFLGTLPQNSVADLIQSRLVHTAAEGNGEPLEVYLAARSASVDREDWRRLAVLHMRSAAKVKMTIIKVDEE
ncbi:hypothetical protein HWV62_34595 [Athelia sp. TMB]|nr:hypothetical protein HWV62_34595 [Athelia sp. TMB]